MKMLRGGGAEILCVFGGVKGEGVKSGYITKALIT